VEEDIQVRLYLLFCLYDFECGKLFSSRMGVVGRYSTPPGFTWVLVVGAHTGFCSASTSVLQYNSDHDLPPAGLWWLPRLGFCVRKKLQAWAAGTIHS